MNQPTSSLNLPQHLITKLEIAGYHHLKDLETNLETVNTKFKLPDLTPLTQVPKAKTALELAEEESNFSPIATLIPELDALFSRIALPGCITELCGFPGSGRTQVCLHLAVGAKSKAVFIHTKKNLNPLRLREICAQFGLDAEATLAKILCVEATNPFTLMASVEFLQTWFEENSAGVVIVDSVSWPLKQLVSNERTKVAYTLLQNLRGLANKHTFTIVLTNDLTTRIMAGQAYTSSFGDSFYHLVNNRVVLSREGASFSAEVLKSINGGPETIKFQML